MSADAEYCPIIPQGEHGEGVGGERGAGGGHTVVSLSPSRHHCLPRHLNKGKVICTYLHITSDRKSYLTMNVEGFLLHIEDELLTVLHLELDILDEDLFQEMEMLILELRPYVKFHKSIIYLLLIQFLPSDSLQRP